MHFMWLLLYISAYSSGSVRLLLSFITIKISFFADEMEYQQGKCVSVCVILLFS
jgi:hypothetical protein